ncbi:fluoride efflux transporter FluC [Salinicoccus sp. HZC-1]|uniref:fluoride efflux transporter FluC n=1 Tax=Salinicoccus sp. HZC-1 TaxID=3385497 RepID=UPI00398B0CFC
MIMLIISISAAFGAVLRAVIIDCKIFNRFKLPYGTFTVNLTGSFLMGIFIPLLFPGSLLYTGLIAGFLGGFTTYSAFSLDQLLLLREKRYGDLFKYTFITLVSGLTALALGLLIGDAIV